MSNEPKTKNRNRDETERRIVQAAMDVLVEGGHQDFGVNAIARRADCDKQLIYRYFDGLEGLADAIGVRLASRLEDDLSLISLESPPTTYHDLMYRLALALLETLRSDRVMQRVIAWELSGPSPLVQRMAEARSRRLGAWMQRMRGDLQPPPQIDAPAVNAVLIASTQHLVLSASSTGAFAGMALQSEADWDRVRDALKQLVDAIYATQEEGRR